MMTDAHVMSIDELKAFVSSSDVLTYQYDTKGAKYAARGILVHVATTDLVRMTQAIIADIRIG